MSESESGQPGGKSGDMTEFGGWDSIRQRIRERLGPAVFDAWFRTLRATVEGGTLAIECPDRFSRDWIERRYGAVVRTAAAELTGVEYKVASAQAASSAESAPIPLPTRGSAAPEIVVRAPQSTRHFDDFVVGPANALALEASRAVAEGRPGRCSPLVLAAEPGLGKTHLCRAIQRSIGTDIVFRSAEEFTSEVTQAMRAGQMQTIRHRYRKALNVLILEDVQFLAGKRATQIELFHTLDHLITRGKTVVLSTDRPPSQIQGLDPQLAARMTTGLVASIARPEAETRQKILREKAACGGISIPDECLEMLASRPVQNIRDLLVGLNQVVARASLLRQKVSVELVVQALEAVEVAPRAKSVDEIVKLIARSFNVDLAELRGPSRQRKFVRPRQIAMYLSRRYTDASLKEIGNALSRDHSSVVYAIEAVEKRVVEKPQLRYELEALAQRLA